MGSFNATCIISNLQIEAGTPVRYLALTGSAFHRDGNDYICYVGGRWQLRGPPIRAQYNDYGSIEHLKKRLTNRVFFDSLARDCVEKGVGDNQCHDVQVRRNMTHKQWLEALWEGRVYVTDWRKSDNWPPKDWKPEEPPEGMPSLSRIEKILKDNNLPVVVDYGAEGFVIDELSRGFIRIRYGRHSDNEEGALQPVLPLLNAAGYVSMITCGTGRYQNHAEILVAPKPAPEGGKDSQGRDIHFFSQGVSDDDDKDYHRPRPVSQAMIREDVWQILLKTTIKSWRKDFTFADVEEAATEVLDQELAWRAEEKAFQARDPKDVLEAERNEMVNKVFRRRMGTREDTENIFRSCLQAHEGVSGFSLKEAFEFGLELSENREELEGFITDMAETAYVQVAYAHLHGQWHPTTNSGQDANWKQHRAFLKALMKIKGGHEEE
jgi:hypothetical protein